MVYFLFQYEKKKRKEKKDFVLSHYLELIAKKYRKYTKWWKVYLDTFNIRRFAENLIKY